ncbi:uncharacterized protein C3orf22 homolog [Notamacropus eugenii]|uniref:uncharacterized protein C3orf22 homolog n=1 Tax=Notamacropus eugenii TaxID=9315 RepID=UPI003B67D4F4
MEAEHQRSESGVRSISEQTNVLKKRTMVSELREDQVKASVNQHENCGRPITVPLYPGVEGHENESSYPQGKFLPHDKSKKEAAEEFALRFPYRLAWLTKTGSEMSRTKPWETQKMLGHLREKLPLQKSLQPTQSIPSKGTHVLVTSVIPPSRASYIPPLRNPLEDKLLSRRFPKQKARLQELLGYRMYGWLTGRTEASGFQGPRFVVEFNNINFPTSPAVHSS